MPHYNALSVVLYLATLYLLLVMTFDGMASSSICKCGPEQNYLRETVQEKGRDISTFDEFAPALVDCFFVIFFIETMLNIHE
jgi:hypothetical protein